jgi:hypothetical protein
MEASGKRSLPVAGDDRVLFRDAGLNSAANGLLAGAKVTESAHGFFLVEVGRRGLHAAHGYHVVVELEALLPRQGGRRGRT